MSQREQSDKSRQQDEAMQATIRALRIIAAGEAPYGDLPLEVMETCTNAADYLCAPSSTSSIDEDQAEFLREAQAQLANVIERGDIEAVRWMARAAESYHDQQESCADSMGVPESAEYHRKRREEITALLSPSATASAWTLASVKHPAPHARYIVRREGVIYTATPCYGMHAPWWVIRTMQGEAEPVRIEPTDEWMPSQFDIHREGKS